MRDGGEGGGRSFRRAEPPKASSDETPEVGAEVLRWKASPPVHCPHVTVFIKTRRWFRDTSLIRNGSDENKALVQGYPQATVLITERRWYRGASFIRNGSVENESLLWNTIIRVPRVGASHHNDVVR